MRELIRHLFIEILRKTSGIMKSGDNLSLGLSYDDVLIVPQSSPVKTRKNVSTRTRLIGDIEIDVPVIASNMDTVTEVDMAQAMSDYGGVGILHRFMEPETQADMVASVEGTVGASVGINEPYVENARSYFDAGADFVCVDVAHGHMDRCVEAVEDLTTELDGPIMAGNVATAGGAKDLALAGADSIKVGIGPGSTCQTRKVSGVGVPQFTAVQTISDALETLVRQTDTIEQRPTIIADGGITSGGDMSKALLGGADAVMVGSLLAGCAESPSIIREFNGDRYKVVRGMSSEAARADTEAFDEDDEDRYIEGMEGFTEYTGTVEEHLTTFIDGVKSSFSYVGATDLETAQENAEFMRVTAATQQRNSHHNVHDGPQ